MTPLQKAIERIEKARLAYDSRHIVRIVVASKYADVSQIKSLYEQGQRAFGENRVQDMIQKASVLEALPLEWHFMGRIQTNKINHLLSVKPSLIHSVDSLSTAKELNMRCARDGFLSHILLQINSAEEFQKAGVSPYEAYDIYEQIRQECKSLKLEGVMTIGAHSDEIKVIAKSFETTRKIFDSLSSSGAHICSMGMSGDFETAISCGSNMVRLGSILFAD